ELGFDGIIFSDDLQMKAITNDYTAPAAAVAAIAAGCDGALLSGGDANVPAAACEALIHAVETETIHFSHVEDALARHRRAKERFLAAGVAARPASGAALRRLLGRDEHQAIAAEMARFA